MAPWLDVAEDEEDELLPQPLAIAATTLSGASSDALARPNGRMCRLPAYVSSGVRAVASAGSPTSSALRSHSRAASSAS